MFRQAAFSDLNFHIRLHATVRRVSLMITVFPGNGGVPKGDFRGRIHPSAPPKCHEKKGRAEDCCPPYDLEAAPGLEPGNNGFADRCLSHLAMPPFGEKMERANGFEPSTSTLARWHSTTELRPLSL
jgi:hypothetical protein